MLKSDSDNVMLADADEESLYEEVPVSLSSVYAENNRNLEGENSNDISYQKWLKSNADNVIPAEDDEQIVV